MQESLHIYKEGAPLAVACEGGRRDSLPFDEAVARFKTQLRADGRAANTVTSYMGDLALFGMWIETEERPPDVGSLTPDDLGRFILSPLAAETRDGRSKAPASIHKIAMSIRSFFAFLELSGVVPVNPARLLRVHRPRREPPEVLTDEERRRLLQVVAHHGGELAVRDHMILHLFMDIGIRLRSLVGLDVGDVHLEEKQLIIRSLKGGGGTSKFMPSGVRHHLEEYLPLRTTIPTDCAALFVSARGQRLSARQVERIVAIRAAEAGIRKEITPHTLRHSFASSMYARTRDILAVQKALDHRFLSSTEIYTHITDSAYESAVEKASA